MELFNDLHEYDISTEAWENLTIMADPTSKGAQPSPRWGHGLISVAGKLFIFGGIDEHGMLIQIDHWGIYRVRRYELLL